jgi:alkanesulfonate monooxygenase SsuD/methylene tetrahydromethanopterin reductase-like flavin-dependent oxidoreductase (luciferase family)
MPAIRVGLQLPSFSFAAGVPALRMDVTRIAQSAEAAGFDSLWMMDHFFQLPEDSGWGGPDEPMLEA